MGEKKISHVVLDSLIIYRENKKRKGGSKLGKESFRYRRGVLRWERREKVNRKKSKS